MQDFRAYNICINLRRTFYGWQYIYWDVKKSKKDIKRGKMVMLHQAPQPAKQDRE